MNNLPPPTAAAGPGTRTKRVLAGSAVVLTFAAGLLVGVALPEDTTDLETAASEAHSARQEVESLRAQLATSEETNTELAESLDQAEQRATAAEAEADRNAQKQQARAAKLDARKQRLDEREQALQEAEDDLQARDVEAPGTATSAGGSASTGDSFDRAWALQKASDITEDIATVDERLSDGIGVASALRLLADSYGRLLDAGIPPGVDEGKYYGRVTTLQSFAEQAADDYYLAPSEATASYAVIREQTEVLFKTLNRALGTDLRLP